MSVPLAVVGMDFREGPTSVRALLKAFDDGPDSPSQRLRSCGEATGIVRIESCSRIEWVVSAVNPVWAGELLRGALLSRLGEHGAGRVMHAKFSRGAIHYLVRVALGLESVAEGEHAIGRQIIKAFEAAHGDQATDRTLNLCWHALGRLLQLRRNAGVSSSVGVQSLVVDELQTHYHSALRRTGSLVQPEGKRLADATMLVLGLGDIGTHVLAALRRDGFLSARGYRRAQLPQFMNDVCFAHAAIICTGAPRPYLTLPVSQVEAPVVIDVGSPSQVIESSGWARIDLDALLTRRGLALDQEALTALQTLADQGAEALEDSLDDAAQHHVLEAFDSERKRFFEDEIEPMVASLSPKEARRITSQLRVFTHRLLEATRKATRAC